MAELPYMQFFPADWLRDTRMMTASAKGVWIDTLADLWSAPERGLRIASEREWARLWGVEPERVSDLLEELGKVAGVRREKSGKEFRVTIYSRRIIREELERERSRNSKRAEDKKDWAFRNLMVSMVPELFPELSRNVPADFPEDSRKIPGDITETRDHIVINTHNGRAHEIPTVEEAKAYAASAPVPISEACAVAFHDTQQAAGWITKHGHSIADWRAALRRYASVWNENEKSKSLKDGLSPRGSSQERTDHRKTKAATEYPEPTTKLPRL